MKTLIYELHERLVEIPDTCPHCGADFRQPNSLIAWHYNEEKATGNIGKAGEFDSDFDWQGGDGFHENEFVCAACTKSVTPPAGWEDDHVQFMRLLGEMASLFELTPEQYRLLGESMDLPRERIDELFERAQRAWDDYKESLLRADGKQVKPPEDFDDKPHEEKLDAVCDECGQSAPPYSSKAHEDSCSRRLDKERS